MKYGWSSEEWLAACLNRKRKLIDRWQMPGEGKDGGKSRRENRLQASFNKLIVISVSICAEWTQRVFQCGSREPVRKLWRLRAATGITLFVTWVSVRVVGPNQSQPEPQCSASQITLFIPRINSSSVEGNNISFFLIMFSGNCSQIHGSVTSVLREGPGGCSCCCEILAIKTLNNCQDAKSAASLKCCSEV